MQIAQGLIIIIIIFAILLAITIIWGVRAHRQKVLAGKEDMIGQTAEVTKALEPKGTVFIQGERWKAISEQGPVKAGEEVTILKVEGLKLYVAKKE